MRIAEEQKVGSEEMVEQSAVFLLSCARLCEFKKCCKKYKHGKRCKKCPGRKDK